MKWLAFAGAVPVTAFALSFVWGALVGDELARRRPLRHRLRRS